MPSHVENLAGFVHQVIYNEKEIKKRILLQLASSNEKLKPEAAPRNADGTDRHCAGAGSREKLDTHYLERNSYWF